ncbi:VOC family protein [Goodfellowiella coeruleoviolacea]|uniref:Catechol 2,3-dioxygenase n=1 Tax=Goodfellowiella coeruleoviolacea TaxID=334858 RepID=A0AAE3GLU3_9PSEU|nr:VOC family protein [Goodfellowiella coeruleoviolacea]MCP2169953.1 Catechol 2,3-dioxygenase [Goodfellowiella coeruleoviolacea]
MTTAKLPVNGVTELVLEVTDLAVSERFYTEVLGLPVLERWVERKAVWVLAGDTRIGLWTPQVGIARSRPGVHVHFAIHVNEEDYDGVVAHLREHGQHVDEVEFGGQARSAYVEDPDQHIVEFWTWDATKPNLGAPRPLTENVFGL